MNIPIARGLAVLSLFAAARAETQLFDLTGNQPGQRFGFSVAGAGDVDADGWPDLVVGGPEQPSTGHVRVVSGRDGTTLWAWTGAAGGPSPTLDFGFDVDGAGDIDGDGHADVVVGVRNATSTLPEQGCVRVYSGGTGALLHSFWGDGQADRLGQSVAGAGDVDGDGRGDVVAGAPDNDANGAGAGLARVYSGRTGVVLHTFHGDAAGEAFGIAVAGAGDVDADGRDDVVVGAWQLAAFGTQKGYARVYSGADGSVLHTFHGAAHLDRFGLALAGAGDVDLDGHDDVLVGAPMNDAGGSNAGQVKLFSGASGQVLATWTGVTVDADFGIAVAGGGDVDGDGSPDVLIGSPRETGPQGHGRARCYSGATSALLHVYEGDASGYAWLGSSVDFVGDVNLDGRADLIVGAPQDDPAGSTSGRARVYSGVDCQAVNYCLATPNSVGPGATIGKTGSLSVATNDLRLFAFDVPTSVTGVFFYGATQGLVPFGNGYRCLSGQAFRFPAQQAVLGVLQLPVDLSAPVHPAGTIAPASTWNFQCLYRDPHPDQGPAFFNLTDGLSLTFCP